MSFPSLTGTCKDTRTNPVPPTLTVHLGRTGREVFIEERRNLIKLVCKIGHYPDLLRNPTVTTRLPPHRLIVRRNVLPHTDFERQVRDNPLIPRQNTVGGHQSPCSVLVPSN